MSIIPHPIEVEVTYRPTLGSDIGPTCEKAFHLLREITPRGVTKVVIPDFNGTRITFEEAKS